MRKSKFLSFNIGFMDGTIKSFLKSQDKANFSGKEKIFFYKELVYMMKGWVSLMEATEIIFDTSENYAIKTVAKKIGYYLKQGKSLSYALSRLPEYFDEGDGAIIKTGEATGNLPVVLQSLADEYAYLNEIKQKYIGAMIYPVSLIVISFVAVIYLFAFVLPGIFEIIGEGAENIPTVTLVLKNISEFFVNNWINIVVVVIVLGILFAVYAATETGRKNLYRILLNLPIIGPMTRSYYLIKWARYMRLMVSSGMDYVETFRLLRDVLDIPLYQNMIEQVLADISLGKSLYEPIKSHPDIIPSNVSVLIKVGEETANLDNSMTNIIAIYQEELDNSIKNFSKAIEPLILIVVGAIVMLIALGVFGLIFAVMDSSGL